MRSAASTLRVSHVIAPNTAAAHTASASQTRQFRVSFMGC